MPSKKRITRVHFNDTSRMANQQSGSENATRSTSHRSNSPSNSYNPPTPTERTCSRAQSRPENSWKEKIQEEFGGTLRSTRAGLAHPEG